jgi:hypothetical protein
MIISRLLAATMVAGQPEPHGDPRLGSASRPVNMGSSTTKAATKTPSDAPIRPRG